MTEYGEAIRVDGVRPDWLRDDEQVIARNDSISPNTSPMEARHYNWICITSIRLPATHSYYAVQRYNAEHGTSFVYWPGGDEAPADWDKNAHPNALWRCATAHKNESPDWRHHNSSADIIGYIPRPIPQPATSDTVTLARMSEAEWQKRDGIALDPFTLKALGLIREPTRAETIAAKSGVAVDVVERVLGAMGDD